MEDHEDYFKKCGTWGIDSVGVNPKTGNVVAYFTNAVKYGSRRAPDNEENIYECTQRDIAWFANSKSYLPENAARHSLHVVHVFETARKAIQDYKIENGIPITTPPVDLESLPGEAQFGIAANAPKF